MKFVIGFICLVSLCYASFQDEFLNEVENFALLNPTEVVDEEIVFLKEFQGTSFQEKKGDDRDIRPLFVTVQGDVERTIAFFLEQKKISRVEWGIHTPTPATPLCIHDKITEGILDPTLIGDPRRIYTVMKRPSIVRDLLSQGAILHAVFPEEGRAKRSEEQLIIYENLKQSYPNLHENVVEFLPLELVGATYLVETAEGESYLFSIRATQANAPEDSRSWAIWFGSIEDPVIQERYTKICQLFSFN